MITYWHEYTFVCCCYRTVGSTFSLGPWISKNCDLLSMRAERCAADYLRSVGLRRVLGHVGVTDAGSHGFR
jgi:hypothetical protein